MSLRALVGGVVFAAGTALSVVAAGAADLAPAPAPAAVAPVYSWTGFYIGGHTGAGYAASSWSHPFTGGTNIFNSGAGFLGGAQAGANYQLNVLYSASKVISAGPASKTAAPTRSATRSTPVPSGRRP